MPINMQGSWTLSVSLTEAGSSPQRFTVSGATTGNGTYAGDFTTPPVHVTGAAWAVTVEHNSGGGWRTSFDQITFPTRSGGQYRFDVQANDDDIDPVFDDLVITASTPVTLTDYVIYGNVSHYSDACIFNPCSPIFLVIDTYAAFARALENPTLRSAIEVLYPERIPLVPRGPTPDPPPFQKLVLPLGGESHLPTRVSSVFAPDGVSGLERDPGHRQHLHRSAHAAQAGESAHRLRAAGWTGQLPRRRRSHHGHEHTASQSAHAMRGVVRLARLLRLLPRPSGGHALHHPLPAAW